MNDLERILDLAGLGDQNVAEDAMEKKQVCKDCGDEFGHPTTDCENSAYDKDGDHWIEIDVDGDGDTDIKVARDMKEDDMEEAVGDSAECFYNMQDDFAGGEADGAHKVLIDELVRYLSGDQLEDFCDDFKRHHDMGMDEADIDEADIEENAFNQAAAAAARAGKDTFEFGGKTHKTTMKKDTAHKLDDDVQMESCGSCGCDLKNPTPGCECDSHKKESVDESPTMDTTQLVTLLKNSGLSEEAIAEKLDEWANTPEGVGEVDPTSHGDAYDFAQGVNLSLKKYLDAEDMKVGLKEHTVESLKEAYQRHKE